MHSAWVNRLVAEMGRKHPEQPVIGFDCLCGWTTPMGRRQDSLRAIRRHLMKCH